MKTWLITGASRGFGVLIAQAALDAGDRVIATARNPKSIPLAAHPRLVVAKLDVTDEAEAQRVVAEAGRIDVLVNNAGFGLLGGVEESSAAEIEKLYRTNVFGLLAVTRAVLPVMRQQRSGHVINLSSIGGYRSSSGWGVYCSTKFAVEGLSEALHDELAPLGIHVTVVEPGYFRTDFLDAASLTRAERIIPDYAQTSGAMRSRAVELNHQQPGDPAKLATAMMELVKLEQPPLRLALGSDTVKALEEKNAFVARELEAHRALSLSTDFT
ncbi:SDR family NAD(P)-dependent oxidoreductase [Corallococcus sp. AB004]|uniref:oxidoreductase n=1 Tax=Corallococcus exiguus TaxID=83462 RepID=UPI000EA012CF|nr:oxidoreductase [Corallococcus exiguus]NPC72063.1 SDR family NAD(P)-dependent oxidoreductase [Corallococcus exiguus]NPD26568.1 SDR family NAD(P)-dependent oxidoreductase [Corallococcus exiguus]NRD44977.1 SDR family NAD(P)-dependent oxidoreductase [Corallococcus exiguus]RKI40346.1 SDR family NAD(P)-dependent oxidoreductase [Corallococcus sp. AB004]